MRILIINSEYPPIGGGAGNATAYIARQMIASGHEVSILTSKFKDLPWYEEQDRIKLFRAPARRKRMDRSRAHEQVSFILGAGLRALSIVMKEKPQIILAFFGMPSGAVALPLKWLFGIPYVVSLRGGDVPGFRPYDFAIYHRLISPLLRIIWRQAGAVVANSSGLRAMAQRFERRVPIEIIPNGVDPEVFSPPPRSWEPTHMLFVGRVVYQKGLDLLFHALGNLKDFEWTLTVVGDGPQRIPLEMLARNLEISDRVAFRGWLKDEPLLREYQRANLFPYPSRHEGMPNAVLEAMASGLPVIASRIPGNEELVIVGETGFLVESENQQALEDALRSLLADKNLRQYMGENGRKRVVDIFPWSQVTERYLEIFIRMLSLPRS